MAITLNGTDGVTFPDATVQSSAAFDGANTNAVGSSAITLGSSSAQYQVAQINSYANSYITLPDATQLGLGSNPFVIENRSPIGANLEIRNFSGTTVGYIPVAQIATVQLKDKSTSAGQWAVELVGQPQGFFNYDSASITTTTNATLPFAGSINTYGIVGLTSTTFVRWWLALSGYPGGSTIVVLYTQVGVISGSTISFGSAQTQNFITGIDTTSGVVSNLLGKVVRLSNTAFAIHVGIDSYTNNACVGVTYNGQQRISVCTVSGTTVTFGTPSAAGMPSVSSVATGTNNQSSAIAQNGTICRVSDTVFALFYNDGTTPTYTYPYNYSGSMACQIVSVSGVTMTIGTKVTLATSTYSQVMSAIALSSTSVFLCYGQAAATGGSTGRSKIIVVSVSGTVPTFNTPVNCESTDVTCFGNSLANGAVSPSATQVVFSTGYSTGECTISGTVPTFDSFPRTSISAPLFLSTSSKAWTSFNAYLFITTGGFVVTTNNVNVLQTNLSVTSATPWSPLGAQPTTAYVAYKANTGNSSSPVVLLGSTT